MEITSTRLQQLFDYDTGTGDLRRDGAVAGYTHSTGYTIISVDGKQYRAHRLVWLMHHGVWPPAGMDHVNGVKCDNRLENIRPADQATNNKNKRVYKTNTSGLSGVVQCGELWRVHISVAGVLNWLYSGQDFFEACCRRKSAELKHNYTGRVK